MHYYLDLKLVREGELRRSCRKLGIISIIKAFSTCSSSGKRTRLLEDYRHFLKFYEVSQSCSMLKCVQRKLDIAGTPIEMRILLF